MTISKTCYRLVVTGRLSETVTQLIDVRFGATASIGGSGTDSTIDLTADQPALRALLTMLWDFGHDLVAIQVTPPPAALRSSPTKTNTHHDPV